ncbi:ABC transporter permease [Desulfurobacterium atlanticum]|uniref:Putative ABC transport system permease protein n=1 Tax=Desulfurobacterium atlanticum TaxID=240169 RepID=A0A238YJA1_9BACT|nr:ABC transporter permease [Desulfurobacterium atlanticum]SNR70714.1 putative ABC transport system permease protein [Desulfurobacterium atlanticum]
MNGLYIKDLINSLYHNKVRTFFALLGIVMGVASLVLIVAAIQGSTLRARKVIEALGPDSIFIVSGRMGAGPRMRTMVLSMKDVREIGRLEGIFALTYGLVKPIRVSAGKFSKNTTSFGVGPNWITSWNYKLDIGRDFTPDDYRNFKKVCIIGWDVADFLFPGEDPIGKTILVEKTPFKVIAVFKRRGKTPQGRNIDNRIFIPYPIYKKVVMPLKEDNISLIRLRVLNMDEYNLILQEVKDILSKRHDINKELTIITPSLVKKVLSMISASLSMFLGLASITALVVGGFVLSSIFYINIYVRKWEIGLRRAMGATKKDILIRIMAESVVIALIGAVIGTVIGLLSVKFVLPLLSIPVVYPVEAFIIAVIFSLIVCLIASYTPAKRAAEFEPVESLRSKV